MLKLYRRHLDNCPHREKGANHLKCSCPIWCDGELNGKRYRRSLKTRDLSRAAKKLAKLDNPEAPQSKLAKDAVGSFLRHCEALKPSTQRKYRNVMDHVLEFCKQAGVEDIDEFTLDVLDDYRAARRSSADPEQPLSRITAIKELQTLRQFFTFCQKRRWTKDNPAKETRLPKAVPNQVVPYTSDEVARIIRAAGEIGKTSYERRRAVAQVLLLRYTALRVSDVAMFSRDRVRDGQILLHTQKTGGAVYLPMPIELQTALDALPEPRGAATGCVHYFWNGTTSVRAAVGIAERTLAAVFKRSGVVDAHAHRFRHTLATEVLTRGGTEQDVADILAISPAVVRKHYAKWTQARQVRINSLMAMVHGESGTILAHKENEAVIN